MGNEASTSPFLFVYGSLKGGLAHHRELRGAKLVGPARTAPRYRLLDLGRYPALAMGGSRAVLGELYRVSPDLLLCLDEFEGDDYLRAEIKLDDGRTAQAYLATPGAAKDAHEIPAERWPVP